MSEPSLPARLLADPVRLAWALAAVTALALAIAHGLEAAGFAPCPLCLYQRYPYYAAVPVLAVGAILGRPRPALVVALLLYLGDLSIALYHVGVEQGILTLPESCAAAGRAETLEELKRLVLETVPRCDRPEFFFLGLTLAAWNALFALALTLVTAAGLRALRR